MVKVYKINKYCIFYKNYSLLLAKLLFFCIFKSVKNILKIGHFLCPFLKSRFENCKKKRKMSLEHNGLFSNFEK